MFTLYCQSYVDSTLALQYMILYILHNLGVLKMQMCEKFTWKLCVLLWIAALQSSYVES
jgi:hypothetical protein